MKGGIAVLMGNFPDYEYIRWDRLESFLRKSIPSIPDEEMQIKKFSEGYSNLTYLITIGSWEGVLRRPPLGEIPPRAHDMYREYKILSKVHPVFPLAPNPYVYSEGQDIMERHFYIMEKKEGIVVDEHIPDSLGSSEEVGPILSKSLINTLIQMQSIDYQKADLTDIGKPDRYLERQVNGWIKRYERSKTEEIPHVKELEKWFLKNMPHSTESTIVHNDFKLNNLVLDEHNPGVVNGVLDWELSTIGDPLTDVGSTVAYWGQSEDPDLGIHIVTNQPGFYSRREFVEEYAKQSKRDVSNIKYYVSFGFYKLAVILQQIYHRWVKGEVRDDRFKDLNVAVANLMEMAQLTKSNRIL